MIACLFRYCMIRLNMMFLSSMMLGRSCGVLRWVSDDFDIWVVQSCCSGFHVMMRSMPSLLIAFDAAAAYLAPVDGAKCSSHHLMRAIRNLFPILHMKQCWDLHKCHIMIHYADRCRTGCL